MDSPYLYLIAMTGLIALSAFFSGSETALLSLDHLRIQYLVNKKRRGAKLLESIREHPDQLLGAILVGNNLVNIAATVVATTFFVQHYGELGEMLTVLVLTPIVLVFAEVCPKSYAARNPERVSFLVLRPIYLIMIVLKPVVWLVTGISRLVNRFSKGEENQGISEDHIRTMISVGEEAGVVGQENRRMLHGVFDLAQIRARDIVVPRQDVVGIDVSTPFPEVLEIVQKARHSRFPVYVDSMDQVVGVIHSKDILSYVHRPEKFVLREMVRKPYFVPEAKRINVLLQKMRQERIHLAMVVDEYGRTEGVITLEDIVEEIVGDIQDEYDADEDLFRELGPDRFLVVGNAPLRDVNLRFNLSLSEENAVTMAGLFLHLFGAIPVKGDCCNIENIEMVVQRVVGQRIAAIELKLATEAAE